MVDCNYLTSSLVMMLEPFELMQNLSNHNVTEKLIVDNLDSYLLPTNLIHNVSLVAVLGLALDTWRHNKLNVPPALIGLFFYLLLVPILCLFWIFSIFIQGLIISYGVAKTGKKLLIKMNPEDALWAQDTQEAKSIITAVITLEGRPDKSVIVENITQNLSKEQRLHSIIQSSMGYYFWGECEQCDFTNNIKVINLGQVKSKNHYQNKVDELLQSICNVGFPENAFPWEILVIAYDECALTINEYSVIIRIHHSIADGVSMIQILLNNLLKPSFKMEKVFKKYPPPRKLQISEILYFPVEVIRQFSREDKNPLHGPKLSGSKLVRTCKPIELNKIKLIKNFTNTTVNDVLMTCIASSFTKFFQTSKSLVNVMTAALPIMLKKPQDITGAANWFSVGVVRLPTLTSQTPLQKLQKISSICSQYKTSNNHIMNGILIKAVVSVLPQQIARNMFNKLPNTLVVSNIMGPTQQIQLWEQKVKSIKFVTPHRGNTGVSVGILSYNDFVYVTVNIDSALISEEAIDRLTEDINGELQVYYNIVERKLSSNSSTAFI